MNKYSARNILLMVYAFIAGGLFGGAFAFFMVIPVFRIILASITGSDAGPRCAIYFINVTLIVSIIGGIYISEKWCLNYIARKKSRR
jgi:uncharacterized protein YneF (UPF0154 family)